MVLTAAGGSLHESGDSPDLIMHAIDRERKEAAWTQKQNAEKKQRWTGIPLRWIRSGIIEVLAPYLITRDLIT